MEVNKNKYSFEVPVIREMTSGRLSNKCNRIAKFVLNNDLLEECANVFPFQNVTGLRGIDRKRRTNAADIKRNIVPLSMQ